jgi:hypothetical protein
VGTAVNSGLFIAAVLIVPVPASAQQGFALKAGPVFNSSDVREQETSLRLSDAAGWSAGIEYLLPMGLAFGLSGYTAGSPDAFDVSEGSLVMLAETNLFVKLPLLPFMTYGGVHVGLGTYTIDEVRARERPTIDFGDRGWQVGARIQLFKQLGIDAQYRRVSGSLAGDQDDSFETNQFTLGAALF